MNVSLPLLLLGPSGVFGIFFFFVRQKVQRGGCTGMDRRMGKGWAGLVSVIQKEYQKTK